MLGAWPPSGSMFILPVMFFCKPIHVQDYYSWSLGNSWSSRVIYPKRRSHFVVILFQILEIMCEENSDLYESSSPKPGIIAKEAHLNTFSKAEVLSNLAETDVIVLAWPWGTACTSIPVVLQMAAFFQASRFNHVGSFPLFLKHLEWILLKMLLLCWISHILSHPVGLE